MKHTVLLAALLLVAPVALAQATSSTSVLPPASVARQLALQGGPGIAGSGSVEADALPPQAQNFLREDYPSTKPSKITRNFVRDTYHVTLADGTRITFSKDGVVTGIIAPGGTALPLEVLADILPQNTSIHLAEAGMIDEITEIQGVPGKGTVVMLLKTVPPTMLFDLDGNFVVTYY